MLRVVLFLLVLFTSSALANDEYWTALCIEDQSTGFSWENGHWVQTNFKPEKFLIQRLENKPQKLSEFDIYDVDPRMALITARNLILGLSKIEHTNMNIFVTTSVNSGKI
ncbi:MAG: hypothetical protein ACI9HY_000788 [Planctomycetaceae bacterium]|jgi:hypothetical protein